MGWWLRRGGEADSRWSQAEWGVRVPGEADWRRRCGRLGREEGREFIQELNDHWRRRRKTKLQSLMKKRRNTRKCFIRRPWIMSMQETTPSDSTAPLNHTQAQQNAHRAQWQSICNIIMRHYYKMLTRYSHLNDSSCLGWNVWRCVLLLIAQHGRHCDGYVCTWEEKRRGAVQRKESVLPLEIESFLTDQLWMQANQCGYWQPQSYFMESAFDRDQ